MNKAITLTLTLLLLLSVCSVAQDNKIPPPDPENPVNENLEVPSNWKVRTDRAPNATVGSDKDNSDIYFVNMVPGWHITTGPAAIFYHPGLTASGNFEAKAEIHLFEPARDREAFGIFIGGKNLDNSRQSYTYFLLRNTGEYLLKKRAGNDTETIQGWDNASPMVRYTDESNSSVKNTLTIQSKEDTVTILLNGEELVSIPKNSVDTNGIVGLRVNHNLNLHVSDLSVTGL